MARATSRTSMKSRRASRSPTTRLSGSASGSVRRSANRPKAWVGGVPGPIGLKTRATITSSGVRSARPAAGGQVFAASVRLSRIARVGFIDRQVLGIDRSQLGGRARQDDPRRLADRPERLSR